MKKFRLLVLTVLLTVCLGLFAACDFILKDDTYTITVIGGTADKTTAGAGERITLTLGELPEGKEFAAWEVNGVEIEGNTFIMPAKNVIAEATYNDVEVSEPISFGPEYVGTWLSLNGMLKIEITEDTLTIAGEAITDITPTYNSYDEVNGYEIVWNETEYTLASSGLLLSLAGDDYVLTFIPESLANGVEVDLSDYVGTWKTEDGEAELEVLAGSIVIGDVPVLFIYDGQDGSYVFVFYGNLFSAYFDSETLTILDLTTYDEMTYYKEVELPAPEVHFGPEYIGTWFDIYGFYTVEITEDTLTINGELVENVVFDEEDGNYLFTYNDAEWLMYFDGLLTGMTTDYNDYFFCFNLYGDPIAVSFDESLVGTWTYEDITIVIAENGLTFNGEEVKFVYADGYGTYMFLVDGVVYSMVCEDGELLVVIDGDDAFFEKEVESEPDPVADPFKPNTKWEGDGWTLEINSGSWVNVYGPDGFKFATSVSYNWDSATATVTVTGGVYDANWNTIYYTFTGTYDPESGVLHLVCEALGVSADLTEVEEEEQELFFLEAHLGEWVLEGEESLWLNDDGTLTWGSLTGKLTFVDDFTPDGLDMAQYDILLSNGTTLKATYSNGHLSFSYNNKNYSFSRPKQEEPKPDVVDTVFAGSTYENAEEGCSVEFGADGYTVTVYTNYGWGSYPGTYTYDAANKLLVVTPNDSRVTVEITDLSDDLTSFKLTCDYDWVYDVTLTKVGGTVEPEPETDTIFAGTTYASEDYSCSIEFGADGYTVTVYTNYGFNSYPGTYTYDAANKLLVVTPNDSRVTVEITDLSDDLTSFKLTCDYDWVYDVTLTKVGGTVEPEPETDTIFAGTTYVDEDNWWTITFGADGKSVTISGGWDSYTGTYTYDAASNKINLDLGNGPDYDYCYNISDDYKTFVLYSGTAWIWDYNCTKVGGTVEPEPEPETDTIFAGTTYVDEYDSYTISFDADGKSVTISGIWDSYTGTYTYDAANNKIYLDLGNGPDYDYCYNISDDYKTFVLYSGTAWIFDYNCTKVGGTVEPEPEPVEDPFPGTIWECKDEGTTYTVTFGTDGSVSFYNGSDFFGTYTFDGIKNEAVLDLGGYGTYRCYNISENSFTLVNEGNGIFQIADLTFTKVGELAPEIDIEEDYFGTWRSLDRTLTVVVSAHTITINDNAVSNLAYDEDFLGYTFTWNDTEYMLSLASDYLLTLVVGDYEEFIYLCSTGINLPVLSFTEDEIGTWEGTDEDTEESITVVFTETEIYVNGAKATVLFVDEYGYVFHIGNVLYNGWFEVDEDDETYFFITDMYLFVNCYKTSSEVPAATLPEWLLGTSYLNVEGFGTLTIDASGKITWLGYELIVIDFKDNSDSMSQAFTATVSLGVDGPIYTIAGGASGFTATNEDDVFTFVVTIKTIPEIFQGNWVTADGGDELPISATEVFGATTFAYDGYTLYVDSGDGLWTLSLYENNSSVLIFTMTYDFGDGDMEVYTSAYIKEGAQVGVDSIDWDVVLGTWQTADGSQTLKIYRNGTVEWAGHSVIVLNAPQIGDKIVLTLLVDGDFVETEIEIIFGTPGELKIFLSSSYATYTFTRIAEEEVVDLLDGNTYSNGTITISFADGIATVTGAKVNGSAAYKYADWFQFMINDTMFNITVNDENSISVSSVLGIGSGSHVLTKVTGEGGEETDPLAGVWKSEDGSVTITIVDADNVTVVSSAGTFTGTYELDKWGDLTFYVDGWTPYGSYNASTGTFTIDNGGANVGIANGTTFTKSSTEVGGGDKAEDPFAGTTWVSEGRVTKTLTFGNDGSVQLSDGTRSWSGTYTWDGTKLTITSEGAGTLILVMDDGDLNYNDGSGTLDMYMTGTFSKQ